MRKALSICASVIALTTADAAMARGAETAEAPAPASTTSDEPAPGEIVVTAQRREQRLQDVPLAVTALSEDALRSRNINSVGDLGGGKVPGLMVGTIFGSQSSISLNFRGLAANDPSQGTMDSPAAFYIDGINMPRGQGLALELITPERIEVLRGPQGQLFGRNAEGGALQIVSKRPSGEWGGELTAGIGEFATHYARGRLELPAIGGLKIQLSAFGREHDGYIKNLPNPLLQNVQPATQPLSKVSLEKGNYDRDFAYLESYGGRVAVEGDFGDLNVFYTYDNSRSKENQGYTNFLNAPAVAGTLNNPGGTNGSASIFTLQPGLVVYRQNPLNVNSYPTVADYSNYNPYFITRSRGHSLTLAYNASDALTLKSITGYRHVTRSGSNSLSVAVSTVNPTSTEYLDSKVFSQEVQALYSTQGFNVTAGAIYFHEKAEDERNSLFSTNCAILGPIVSACSPVGQPTRLPYVNSFLPAGVTDLQFQTSTTNAFAAYAQASVIPGMLNEALEITAGLRYSHDTKRGIRTINSGFVLATPIVNEAKVDRFDPAISVKFKLSDDVNIYARYARGFRDGGANVRSDVFSAFGEETLDSFEVGLKSQFLDRRVTLNLAAFHNTTKNYQLQVQPDPALRPSVGDTVNLPFSTKIKGFEGELSVRPFDGFSLTGSVTYLDAPQDQLVGIESLAPNTLTPFIPGGATYSAVTGLVPNAATVAAHPNSRIFRIHTLFAPEWAWSLGADFEKPISGDVKFRGHVDWAKSTDFFTSTASDVTIVTAGVAAPKPTYNAPAHTNTVNIRLAITDIPLGFASAEIAFWGQNVLNVAAPAYTFAAGNGLNASQPVAQSTVYLAPPRVLGGELRIKF